MIFLTKESVNFCFVFINGFKRFIDRLFRLSMVTSFLFFNHWANPLNNCNILNTYNLLSWSNKFLPIKLMKEILIACLLLVVFLGALIAEGKNIYTNGTTIQYVISSRTQNTCLVYIKKAFKALKWCSSLIKEMSYRFQTTLKSKAIFIYFRIGPMVLLWSITKRN